DLQRQADAIDTSLANRHVAGIDGGESLKSLLEQNDDVSRILRDKKGSAIFEIPTALLERKTSITSSAVGVATSGVLAIERTPGIVTEARQQLMIRDALTARPTAMQVIDFVRVNSPLVRRQYANRKSGQIGKRRDVYNQFGTRPDSRDSHSGEPPSLGRYDRAPRFHPNGPVLLCLAG